MVPCKRHMEKTDCLTCYLLNNKKKKKERKKDSENALMMLTLNTVTPAFRSVSNNLPKYRTKAMTANISTHHFTADQNKEGKLVM